MLSAATITQLQACQTALLIIDVQKGFALRNEYSIERVKNNIHPETSKKQATFSNDNCCEKRVDDLRLESSIVEGEYTSDGKEPGEPEGTVTVADIKGDAAKIEKALGNNSGESKTVVDIKSENSNHNQSSNHLQKTKTKTETELPLKQDYDFFQQIQDIMVPNISKLQAVFRSTKLAETIFTCVESLTEDGRDSSLGKY